MPQYVIEPDSDGRSGPDTAGTWLTAATGAALLAAVIVAIIAVSFINASGGEIGWRSWVVIVLLFPATYIAVAATCLAALLSISLLLHLRRSIAADLREVGPLIRERTSRRR